MKDAPGSTDSFPITTSPEISAVVLIVKVLDTNNSPENFPSISALAASTFPLISPSAPIITLPLVINVPSKVPSILKSPSDLISPTIVVFLATTFLSITLGF